ncbi:MAG: Fic family protein [Bacteroidales bacterium]|nr:Fic family protein [Bacteroidales bacterium]
MYIWENIEWPHFQWNPALITEKLGQVRYQQGRLLGMADTLGFDVKSPVVLDVMSADIIKSSEIEGVILNAEEVRSSVAWQLGMDRQGVPTADRYIEGVVDVMFDALHHYSQPLTKERLFGWHSALFPNQGIRSRITVGNWRQSEAPMQVVSGRYGKETVHYEAPPSRMVPQMMAEFLQWLNSDQEIDPLLKAAIAHLWFVSIHPFSDGNGRLARTITDMLLAKADGTSYRFYSMSAQIAKERMVYYNVLEITQKGTLDITDWMIWFLDALDHAIISAQGAIDRTLCKASFWESRRQTVMNERQNKMVNLLWDGFEGALTSSKWAKICKCSPDTALRDITDLLNKRILVKAPSGGRSTHYVLTDNLL